MIFRTAPRAISLLGLPALAYLGLNWIITLCVRRALGGPESGIGAYEFVKAAYYYGKREQLYGFMANTCMLFGLILLFNAWQSRRHKSPDPKLENRPQTAGTLVPPGHLRGALQLFLLAVLLAVGVQYTRIYLPLSRLEDPFFNEFLNLPSMVKVGDTHVDSLDALNRIPQTGVHIASARDIPTHVLRPALVVRDPEAARRLAKEHREFLYFDEFLGIMVSRGPLTQALLTRLIETVAYDPQAVARFAEATRRREALKLTPLGPAQAAFLKQFNPWLLQQVMSRWILHHHNFAYGPISKLLNGYGWKKIFFQYGLATGALHGWLARAIYGEFTLESYFRTFPIFFLLFFPIFAAGLYGLTGSLSLVACGCASFLAFLYSTRYEYLTFGPGLSPLRHFFDVFVFFGLLRYFRRETPLRLSIAHVASLATFVLNPEFGAFCYAGMLFGLLLNASTRSKPRLLRFEVAISLGFALLHLAAWKLLRQGTDGVVSLYLGGFFSPVLSPKKMALYFTVLFAGFTSLSQVADRLDSSRYKVFLSSAFYSALILTYWVWGTSWNHFVSISPILLITIVLGLELGLGALPRPAWRPWIERLGTAILLALLLWQYDLHLESKREYLESLSRLDNRTWSLLGAPITTSIPEAPVRASLDLISKHKHGETFVLFSKFEALLFPLARSYSSLPGNELMTYMMSDMETRNVRAAFHRLNPEYMFADVDMLAPQVDELFDPNAPALLGSLHLESFMRMERINNLKILFRELSQGYTPVESAGLLTLWRRR